MRNFTTKNITLCGLALAIFAFLGITVFDFTIFNGQDLKVNIQKELEPEVFSQIATEKKPEPQTMPQYHRGSKLSFPMLMNILKDFRSYAYRVEFIENNFNLMPESLLLSELNSIFDLFRYSYSYKFKVLKLFLPRLQDNYPHNDFERFKKHFSSSSSYRLKAVNLIIKKGTD